MGIACATIAENVTMGTIGTNFVCMGLAAGARRNCCCSRTPHPLRGTAARSRTPLRALSGGNQQKVLLAKWLQKTPSVLLLHEPTQGIDVGSRQQVFRIIKRTAEAGAAVLIVSTEYGDLAHICNRVLVMLSATSSHSSATTNSRRAVHPDLLLDSKGRSSVTDSSFTDPLASDPVE